MSFFPLLILVFTLIFSLYFIIARPLREFREYLSTLPRDEPLDITVSLWVPVTVIALFLSILSLAIYSFWAYSAPVGFNWAAIIGIIAAGIRVAWFFRGVVLKTEIDANLVLEIDLFGQFSIDSDKDPWFRKVNYVAELVSCAYLFYLVAVLVLMS